MKKNGSRTCDFFLSIRNEHPEQQLFCCEKLWVLRGFDGFLSPHILTMKPSGSKRLRDGPHDSLWSDHFSMMTSIWYPGPLNIIRDRNCDFSFPAYAYIYIYTDTYIYIHICVLILCSTCVFAQLTFRRVSLHVVSRRVVLNLHRKKHQDANDFSEQQHSWQMEFHSLKTKV